MNPIPVSSSASYFNAPYADYPTPVKKIKIPSHLIEVIPPKKREERISYSNEVEYVGETLNGKREGRGKMTHSDGSQFTGIFKNDKPFEGVLTLVFMDKTKFHGVYFNGKCQKEGKIISKTGKTYYEGDTKNFVPHGKGKLYNNCKETFKLLMSGEFRNGAPYNIKGTFKLYDGAIFRGEFRKGVKYGRGQIDYPDGSAYVGTFRQNGDLYQGRMYWNCRDSSPSQPRHVFRGEFLDNEPYFGEGVYHYPNGDVFEGEFRKGVKYGRGKITYASDKSTFKGAFRENEPYRGKKTYANGDVFEGVFRNGNGEKFWGKITYSDGSTFEGVFQEDEPYKGKKTYANGDVYNGEFRGGEKYGKGKITYSDGSTFEGEFRNNEPYKGKKTYANGDVYNGEFRGGKKHGQGKIFFADASRFRGEFRDDQLYKGRIRYKNGVVYEGEFRNNCKHGKGNLTDYFGVIYEGEFRNDKFCEGESYCSASGRKFIGEFRSKSNFDDYEIQNGIGKDVLFSPGIDKPKAEYKGEYMNGKIHGKGKYSLYRNFQEWTSNFQESDKIRYLTLEGEFQNSLFTDGTVMVVYESHMRIYKIQKLKAISHELKEFDKSYLDRFIKSEKDFMGLDPLLAF